MGPTRQDRTCISGQSCRIDGLTGHYLSATDRIMVLDTCDGAVLVPRFPQHGASVEGPIAGSQGLAVSWGEVAVSAAGGRYQLCWHGHTASANGTNASATNSSQTILAYAGVTPSALHARDRARARIG